MSKGKSKKVSFSLTNEETGEEASIQPLYNGQSDKIKMNTDEQLEMNLTWKPPSGFNLSTPPRDRSIFDFDNIENGSKELWLVRLPIGVDASMLDGMTLKLPPREHRETTRLATLQNKTKDDYAIYNIDCEEEASPLDSDEDQEKQKSTTFPVGCQEMHHTKCLLPSKRKNGNFMLAPKEFSRHIAITQLVDIPDPTQAALDTLSRPRLPPEQPKGLKMQFKPYGFDTNVDKSKNKKKRNKKKKQNEDDPPSLQKRLKTLSALPITAPVPNLQQPIRNRPKTIIDIPGLLPSKPAPRKSKNSSSKQKKSNELRKK